MSETAMLEIIEVSKSFAKRQVLNGVTISVAAGEVVGLLGSNGAGKSTLTHIVTGLTDPDHGQVLLEGVDLLGLPMHVRSERGIGYLPQDARSFEELTVTENIRGVLECLYRTREDIAAHLDRLLALLELKVIASQRYDALSGGEQRRVELAKALIRSPKILLLDEPFAALDPRGIQLACRHIRHLTQSGIGILLADHRYEAVMQIADYVAVLEHGSLIATGPPSDIATDLRAIRSYFPVPGASDTGAPS